jgi:hypothetical protein
MKVDDMAAAIHAYPTRSEVAFRAAGERQRQSTGTSSRVWMRRLFGVGAT